MTDDRQRLQKIIARYGVASRRQAEAMIAAGRVKLNGVVVTELGTKADPHQDQIEVDDRPIQSDHVTSPKVSQSPNTDRSTLRSQPKLRYVLLNKPLGVISTCSDPQGRKTVLDLLPSHWTTRTRYYPVGRLDAASTGALLLTNDGDLTLKLTHPRYHLPKTYRVEVEGIPTLSTLSQWQEGILLEDGLTLPARVNKKQVDHRRNRTTLTVVLQEGRNRQIRRVAASLGHPVRSLHRLAIGPLQLGSLKSGHCRPLTTAEIRMLKYEESSHPKSDKNI